MIKKIIEKIDGANCLTDDELGKVEIALRLLDVYGLFDDERIGLLENKPFDLQYSKVFWKYVRN